MKTRKLWQVVCLMALWTCGLAWAQDKTLSVPLAGGVKMDFVLIRPGTFMMGSDKGDPDEKPVHEVRITKPFYMGIHEVTQAQWRAVMDENPSYFKGDDLPVERVSWEEAQGFLAKLKEKVGQGMICRLPTEAEWEYACRAGSKTEYCFGDDPGLLGEYAWYESNSDKKTHPVGQKKPNGWGLYDMHGNVWEWCEDWKDDYSAGVVSDPKGPEIGSCRVLRGGSWLVAPGICRSAFRARYAPSFRNYFGLRVVCGLADAR